MEHATCVEAPAKYNPPQLVWGSERKGFPPHSLTRLTMTYAHDTDAVSPFEIYALVEVRGIN